MVPLASLWAAVLAFFFPLISPVDGWRAYIRAGDFTHQVYPYHWFAAGELAAGRFPLWNPYIYAGHPFQADPQSAVFYPVALLVDLVAGRGGLPFLALQWEVVIDFLLATTFTYLLVRQLTTSRFGGVVGALTFTLAGFLTSYPVQQLPILETAIWLPLSLFCVERGTVAGGRPAWYGGAGVAMGVAFLGGHPQTWLLAVYTCLAYLTYRSIAARLSITRAVVGLVAFAGFAAGVAAVQLLPTVEFLGLSNRDTLLFHVAGHGYDYSSLLNVILPLWRNERGPYIGTVALLHLFLAARSWRREMAFWCTLGVLAIVMSLGDKTPLFLPLYNFVPGFAIFKDQERAIYLFSLAGAVLAGYGAAAFAAGRRLPRRWALALAGAVVAGAAALAAGLETIGRGSPDARNLYTAYAYFLPLALAPVALLWWRPWPRLPRLPAALLLALVGLDLYLVNGQNNLDATPPALPAPTLAAAAALPPSDAPYRVRAGDQRVFAPHDAILLGLQNPAGDSPMVSRWVLSLLASEQEWRLWQLFNVHYILTYADLGSGTERLRQDGDLNTYRMAYPLPRAWMVRDLKVLEDDQVALEALLERRFNPAQAAVLDRAPALSPAGPQPPQDQRVRFLEYGSQRLDIELTSTDDAVLVLSEAYHPGWKAEMDGRPVPIYRANLAFRAVEVPAGIHRLVMAYEPASFRWGLAVTGATVVAFLALAALPWRWQIETAPLDE